MSVTSKGRGWEIRHSLWIGWTFTFGFLSWVSFLYIGLRVTQKGWLLWGFSYLIPLALVVILASVGAPPSLGVPALLLMFVSGIGSIVHAFLVRNSQVVQETLKRCMEALAFLTDYAIRQVEDVKVSPRGDEFLLKCLRYTGDHPSFPQEDVVFHRGLTERDLYLDLGRQNWVPLYPFIATLNCSHCKVKETYFIDMWDQRRGTARMKSFERGHTRSDSQISDALAT